MKSRERRYSWIAGGALVAIIVGICIAQPNEPTTRSQVDQPNTPANVFGVTDPDKWWETSDGQDAWRRMRGGELSLDDMRFIFNEMGEGKSYEEARTMIGHGFSRLKRYAAAPKRAYEAFLEEDWKPATKAWWESAERKAGRTGVVGAAVIGLGDIFLSSFRVVGKAIPEIIAGRESGEQAFSVFAIVPLMVWVILLSARIIERAQRNVKVPFKDRKRNYTSDK